VDRVRRRAAGACTSEVTVRYDAGARFPKRRCRFRPFPIVFHPRPATPT